MWLLNFGTAAGLALALNHFFVRNIRAFFQTAHMTYYIQHFIVFTLSYNDIIFITSSNSTYHGVKKNSVNQF